MIINQIYKLIKGTLYLNFSQFSLIFQNLFLVWYLINFEGVNIYGEYRFILSQFAIFGAFGLIGLRTSLTKEMVVLDNFNLQGTIFVEVLIKNIILSFIGSFLILVYSFFLIIIKYKIIFFILAFIFPFYWSSKLVICHYHSLKKFKELSICITLSQSIGFLAFIISRTLNFSIGYSVAINYLFEILVNSSFMVYIFKDYLIKFKIKRPFFNNTIKYGIILTLSNLPGLVALNIDVLLIANFLDIEKVAIWAVIIQIPEVMRGLLKPMSNVIFPYMLDTKENNILNNKKNLLKIILMITFITIVGVGIYWILSLFIFEFLYFEIKNYYYLSNIFSFVILFYPSQIIIMSYFESLELNKKIIFPRYFFAIMIVLTSWYIIQTANLFYLVLGKILVNAVYTLFLLILFITD